jgi:hypothetical protein
MIKIIIQLIFHPPLYSESTIESVRNSYEFTNLIIDFIEFIKNIIKKMTCNMQKIYISSKRQATLDWVVRASSVRLLKLNFSQNLVKFYKKQALYSAIHFTTCHTSSI